MSDFIDIMIFEGGSGGDWNIKANDLDSITGLTNQVYLALFGGNIIDTVGEQRFDYWANYLLDEENQMISSFERTVRDVALNSSGLQKLEQAAENDLKYLKEYANIIIEASIIGLGRLSLLVDLTEPNNVSTKIKFIWDSTKNELIEKIIL